MIKRKNKHKADNAAVELERMLQKIGRQKYVLRLYVTGITIKSTQAITNIRAVCEEHLAGRYDLQVIDIYQQPTQAIGGQIIAAPTLVKQFPAPQKRMIGDLTDRNRVLMGLDLQENERSPNTKRANKIKWVEL